MPLSSRLAILVPSYNEAEFIGDTLAALKRQTFGDYVCLIGDNASTDRTTDLIAQAVSGDSRFVLHRHAQNIGAQANFSFLVDMAEKEHEAEFVFTFSGHDLISENFLERCLDRLTRTPEASMATGAMRGFSEDAAQSQALPKSVYAFFEQTGIQAFLNSAAMLADCTVINSVWRLATYKRSRVLSDLPAMRGPDHLIISWMASSGPILVDPLCTYFRRFIRRQNNLAEQLERISGNIEVDSNEAHREMLHHYIKLFDERFPGLESSERNLFQNLLFSILYRRFGYNVL